METKTRKEGATVPQPPEGVATNGVAKAPQGPQTVPAPPAQPTAPQGARSVRFWKGSKGGVIADARFGQVLGRVYANINHRGEVTYKAQFVRLFSTPDGSGEQCFFAVRDLTDLLRGLRWSHDWHRRAGRHLVNNPNEVARLVEAKRRTDGARSARFGTEQTTPPRTDRRSEPGRFYLADGRQVGNVLAEIRVGETPRGAIVFRVEILRLYSSASGAEETSSLEPDDIKDAMKGVRWAMSWLWREERRRAKELRRRWLP